jgi:hypothetical protein
MSEQSDLAQQELLKIANMEYRSHTVDIAIKFYKQNPREFAQPPDEEVICIKCPRALWHANLAQSDNASTMHCFCEVMHTYTWSSDAPTRLILCDGPVKAAVEVQAQLAKINQ